MTNRRTFIRHSGGLAIAAAIEPIFARGAVVGANNRICLGIIGCGARGRNVGATFAKNERVQLTAVCDIFDERHALAIREFAPDACQVDDYRRVLENPCIDAVYIATPDHWHAAMAIEALGAGKHVYVEKPLTFSIDEGPLIAKAVEQSGKVLQVGLQQRSGPHYQEAKRLFFDNHRIGKVTLVRTWWNGNKAHLTEPPSEAQPAGLDWDKFLGSRPWRPWNPRQYYNFRAYLDFGGGQFTDLLTHWIDVVHWFTGTDRPLSAVAAGGIYNYRDGRDAPDTVGLLLNYPDDFVVTFNATLTPGAAGSSGIEFFGTGGSLLLEGRSSYTFKPAEEGAPAITKNATGEMNELHVRNFLDCIARGGKPAADVSVGNSSAVASHLGRMAYEAGGPMDLDPRQDVITPAR